MSKKQNEIKAILSQVRNEAKQMRERLQQAQDLIQSLEKEKDWDKYVRKYQKLLDDIDDSTQDLGDLRWLKK
jgi:uncharacterized protein YukE